MMNTNNNAVQQPVAGRENEMARNAGGGYSFALTFRTMVLRFLIMGTVQGQYNPRNRATIQDAGEILPRIRNDEEAAMQAFDALYAVARTGRAPKKDPSILLLAVLMTPQYNPHVDVRIAAARAVPRVIYTATQLFQFAQYLQELGRGGGKLYKTAFNSWWESKDNQQLAYQMVKYRQRDGWCMGDLYSLVRPNYGPKEEVDASEAKFRLERNALAGYAVKPEKADMGLLMAAFPVIQGYERLKEEDVTEEQVVELVTLLGLTWEMIPTQFLNSVPVWDALTRDMPMMALVRNLSRLTRIGAFKNDGLRRRVIGQLGDEEQVKRSRVHPMNMYVALRTYQSGKSVRGDSTWKPHQEIVAALENTVGLAFGNLTPSGKRILIAIDMSASMYWPQNRTSMDILSGEAAALMSYITQAVEAPENVDVVGFQWRWHDGKTSESPLVQAGLCEIPRAQGMSILEYEQFFRKNNSGGTNLAAPLIYARRNKLKYDAFVFFTDNDVNCSAHPTQVLHQYRQELNENAKMLVVACAGTNYSVADPKDLGMLDINGMDSSCPDIISKFLSDDLLS